MIEHVRRRVDVVVLVVLAVVPTLTAAVGRGVADTKLYLFLDPAQLIADARFTWDPQQFAGWVPHQTALYIWPSGPWFWSAELLGLPDWFAHRLWVSLILLAAGLGVRFAARTLGLAPLAAFVAAVAYQLSPYVLPYVSRTSVMLLPWAGLGWIVGFTVRAALRHRWRDAAAVALVVVTVGATNATATLMIVPAPVLWLAWASVRRIVDPRRAAAAALRIGVLSLAVSLWWIVKLAVQGRYGAPVLAYSETLEAVSATSTGPEIARGLGYWLFYVSDPYIATTTAAAPHLTVTRVIVSNFGIVVIGLVGLAVVRWSMRGYAALLVLTGVLLGVGAHTVADPSVLQRIVFNDTRSGLALALRSSSRAVPLVSFGLALGAGALVAALAVRQVSAGPASSSVGRWVDGRRLATLTVAGVVLAMAIVGLPALRDGGLVDPALERDDEVPAAWTDAAAHLDRSSSNGRVLQLPGQESAAFRWGYTVDPPLPGLSRRPLVARDWLPAGSAGVMDLLYALDDRVQSGVLEPGSLAPVARWLGADTIWVAGDIAYDRFGTARPEPVLAVVDAAEGVGAPLAFGPPVPNVPDVPVVDEESLGDPLVGAPLPPVALASVEGDVGAARASSSLVVLAGSGDGLVDAAAAGLLEGDEVVRYAADVDDADLADMVERAAAVVVTDTNRVRAHHWRGSRDVVGFTEDGSGVGVLLPDAADERLAVFPDQSTADTTVALQVGPVRSAASSYGEPTRYRPEDRAVMAVDGDPGTAWITGDRGVPEGQFVEVVAERAVDRIRLVQPLGPDVNRWITSLDVVLDPGAPTESILPVTLDGRSRRPTGQVVPLPRSSDHVRLVVRATDTRERPELSGRDGVGFAEIDLGLGPTEEVVVPPQIDVTGNDDVSVVLTRHRVSATDRWRSDPEPRLVRRLDAGLGELELDAVTVRLDRRASDRTLARLLGADLPVATSRLLGVPDSGGWSAFDGDTTTAWTTGFAGAVGASVLVPRPDVSATMALVQPNDDVHSLVTGVRLDRGDTSVEVAVPPPDADGRSEFTVPGPIVRARGGLVVTITSIAPRTTVDRRTFDVVQLPASIAEIVGVGAPVRPPRRFDTGCRDDLLTIDGRGVRIRVRGDVAAAFAGEPLVAEECDRPVGLPAGGSVLRGLPAHGLQVDRVVLRSPSSSTPNDSLTATAVVRPLDGDRTSRRFAVSGCASGCWFSMGEGRNDGWTARADGAELGSPVMLNGGMGGWWLPEGADEREVEVVWRGQRSVDLALAASGAAVLGLLVLLVAARRNGSRRPAPVLDVPILGLRPRRVGRSRAAWSGVGAALIALVAVSPSVAAATAVGAIVLVLSRRAATVTGPGLLVVVAVVAVMVGRLRSQRPVPDFGWITTFDDLHRPFLVGLLLVVLGVVASSIDEDTA